MGPFSSIRAPFGGSLLRYRNHFVSLTESVDTSTPAGKLMFSMLTAFGEFERELIRERINTGLDRARKQGKQLGRPSRVVDRERVIRMRQDGQSIRKIAGALGVSIGKVHSIISEVA